MGDLSCCLQNLAYCGVESKLMVVIGRTPIWKLLDLHNFAEEVYILYNRYLKENVHTSFCTEDSYNDE